MVEVADWSTIKEKEFPIANEVWSTSITGTLLSCGKTVRSLSWKNSKISLWWDSCSW